MGSERSEAKADGNIALLSRFLPAWETYSPRMEDPDLRVTGVSPAWRQGVRPFRRRVRGSGR